MKAIVFILTLLPITLVLPLTACTGGGTVTETAKVTQTATQTQTITVTETQTVTATTLTGEPKPIEIISVLGPLQPINPGGPIVEITLRNVAAEPIISLTATLELGRPFEFTFDVSPSNPLLPDESISSRQTLIGGGFGGNIFYPLRVELVFQNQPNCVYTYIKQVQITEPPTE